LFSASETTVEQSSSIFDTVEYKEEQSDIIVETTNVTQVNEISFVSEDELIPYSSTVMMCAIRSTVWFQRTWIISF